MHKLTKWAFNNKAGMSIIVVMSLIAGVFSYLLLPMELLPSADNPAVTVTAIGPGYDAKSMEQSVTTPLEDAVSAVKGRTDTLSTSGNGFSQINIFYGSDTDMKEAKAEVESAIANVQLPERVMKPYVVQLNTSMIPVAFVTVGFKDGVTEERKHALQKQVVQEFQKIDGVAQAQLGGVSQPTVSITPDPAKLAEKGVPYQALMGVLQGRDASATVGEKIIDGASGNVKVTATVEGIDELKKLPVAAGVKLGDVADVAAADNAQSVTRVDGENVLLMTITKTSNANAVAVGESIEKTAERLTDELGDVVVKVPMNTSDNITDSVNSMLREVLLGALFATIVILIFMRNFRATLVTIVSIPLSLGITLYLLDLSGVTLNIVTLGGVAVAVGRLVDDSIVVIENIYRRLQKEAFSVDLIIDATKEVATAITSSTLTTVAVFLPMGLLRGGLQAFLLPFALTVSYSLLASLFVALTVVPLLSATLLRGTTQKEHEPSKRFTRFLDWNLSHKWLPLTIAFLLLIGSVAGYASLPKGALDTSDAESLLVTLEFPVQTPFEEIVAEGEKLEAFLVKQPEKDWIAMSAGNSQDGAQYGNVSATNVVNYQIQMKEGADAEALIERIQGQRSSFPNADLNAGPIDMMSGGGGTDVYIDVTGDDPEKLTEASESIMAKVKGVKDVLKVKSNQEQKKPVYTFEVDPVKAKASDIGMQLQGMLNAMPIGQLKSGSLTSSVMLQPVVNVGSESDLKGLTVMTDAGPVPVTSVAKLVKTEEPGMFYHKNGKPYIRITATADPERLSIVGADITKALADVKLPEGVDMFIGGASADQASDFADLGMTALISIFIVYLIMVVTFKTLRAPLAIMFSLPLAAIGAVLGLIVSGVSPDFTAAFGALMLIGIVVTNAIVLIDRVHQNEQHMTIREALLEAAATRMRPIFMTAIATVCAMMPLVLGSHDSGGMGIVSQSLAIVVIGGLVVATVLTLIIVPCIYELLFFRKSRRQRRAAKQAQMAA